MPGVDYNIDLSDLPFSNESYDCVFASHVLEHIKDDRQAVSEIRRILKPAGFAILPVPLVAETTVEYAEANPNESGHVRAPGLDYYQRYWEFFDNVEQLTSADYPPEFQLFTYEDRTRWMGKTMPFHRVMQDDKYVDIVPICYVVEH
jgi:ubiquinone/menaquinone biosynthesis C-methylase UbiE